MPRAMLLLLLGLVLIALGPAPSEARSRLADENANARYASFSAHATTPSRIVSRDPSTGEWAYKPVVRTFRGHTSQVLYLRVAKSSAVQRGRSEGHRVGEESGGSGEDSDEPPLTGGSQDDRVQTIRSTIEHPYIDPGHEFVRDWQGNEERIGSDTSWIPLLLRHLYGEQAAKDYLRETGLSQP